MLILGLSRADLRPERADFLSEKADLKFGGADLSSERVMSEKADWRSGSANLRPERADFSPEKANWRSRKLFPRESIKGVVYRGFVW